MISQTPVQGYITANGLPIWEVAGALLRGLTTDLDATLPRDMGETIAQVNDLAAAPDSRLSRLSTTAPASSSR
jgi:hypothetical protein